MPATRSQEFLEQLTVRESGKSAQKEEAPDPAKLAAMQAKQEKAIAAAEAQGITEGLRRAATAEHEARVEKEAREKLAASTPTIKKPAPKRPGRPRKTDIADAQLPMKIDKEHPASPLWTEQGKKYKRQAHALVRRLGHKLQNSTVELPATDSDKAWEDVVEHIRGILAEANGELNVKGMFYSVLSTYEQVTMSGSRIGQMINPLGWNTTNLTQAALREDIKKEFDDDLIELAVIYGEFFASGPVLRLLGKTFQLCQQLDAAHQKQFAEQQLAEMQTPVGGNKEEQYSDL